MGESSREKKFGAIEGKTFQNYPLLNYPQLLKNWKAWWAELGRLLMGTLEGRSVFWEVEGIVGLWSVFKLWGCTSHNHLCDRSYGLFVQTLVTEKQLGIEEMALNQDQAACFWPQIIHYLPVWCYGGLVPSFWASVSPICKVKFIGLMVTFTSLILAEGPGLGARHANSSSLLINNLWPLLICAFSAQTPPSPV